MDAKGIKKNIIKLANAEQDFRKKIFVAGYTRTQEDFETLRKMDKESTDYMINVVSEFGLPTISLVGKHVSMFAWLLVQHSSDLEFQKKYLDLMKKAKPGDIQPKNIAYLEDRILMYEGKPQKYGTQVIKNKTTGEWKPYTLANRKKINELRKSVGLDTLEEYLRSFE